MKATTRTKQATAHGLEIILDPGQSFVITIRLPRDKAAGRGQQAYRKALKGIITQCEDRLGTYRMKGN